MTYGERIEKILREKRITLDDLLELDACYQQRRRISELFKVGWDDAIELTYDNLLKAARADINLNWLVEKLKSRSEWRVFSEEYQSAWERISRAYLLTRITPEGVIIYEQAGEWNLRAAEIRDKARENFEDTWVRLVCGHLEIPVPEKVTSK